MTCFYGEWEPLLFFCPYADMVHNPHKGEEGGVGDDMDVASFPGLRPDFISQWLRDKIWAEAWGRG